MIEKSTAIVRGRVTAQHAALSGGTVYTNYRVQVSERWKGPASETVEFRVPGGRANGVRQICPGAPELLTDREYVVFLWTSRTGATYIIGFTQGLFEIPKEGIAVRPASGETVLDAATGRPVRSERLEMRLRDLSAHISTGVSKGARR